MLYPLRDWKSLTLRSRDEEDMALPSLQELPAEMPRAARAVCWVVW